MVSILYEIIWVLFDVCTVCTLYDAANGDTRPWLWLLDESIRSCQVQGWHDEKADEPTRSARSYARPRIGAVHVWLVAYELVLTMRLPILS